MRSSFFFSAAALFSSSFRRRSDSSKAFSKSRAKKATSPRNSSTGIDLIDSPHAETKVSAVCSSLETRSFSALHRSVDFCTKSDKISKYFSSAGVGFFSNCCEILVIWATRSLMSAFTLLRGILDASSTPLRSSGNDAASDNSFEIASASTCRRVICPFTDDRASRNFRRLPTLKPFAFPYRVLWFRKFPTSSTTLSTAFKFSDPAT
mmetsp:Transcript_36100/g.101688  ORF Transcript_36100/g.101688 Transcript_36100/m.101688 type:complete len:207 (+) Transcript_36100:261-881(+)